MPDRNLQVRNAWPGWLLHAAMFATAFAAIYVLSSRRFLDFADEGFYYTSAWLAYSALGDLPITNLFMNFGKVLGLPYLVTEPTVLHFRILSLSCWYLVHFLFFREVREQLNLHVPAVLLHVLAGLSLFVFLIPSLSYQNMPYMFTMLAGVWALALSRTAQLSAGKTFSELIPLAVIAGVIAYTPFVVVAPILLFLFYWVARRSPAFSRAWFWIGVAFGCGLLVLVMSLSSLQQFEEAYAFLNSEVVYTDPNRVWTKLAVVAQLAAISLAAGGVLVAAAVLVARRFAPDREREFVLISAGLAAAVYFLFMLGTTDCVAVCPPSVIALIQASVALLPAIAYWAMSSGRGTNAVWPILALYLGVGLFINALSNAPFEYNLKYVAPAVIGLFLIVMLSEAKGWRGTSAAGALAVLAVVCVFAGRVIVFSAYGASNRITPSLWTSTAPLPGDKLAGLYGEPLRVDVIAKMYETYRTLDCAQRPFYAVDSLVLPYYLFERKPRFPHAWVGTRVSASRDIITAERTACVMMQDRVLPGTPDDARTMLDYLRVDPRRDAVNEVNLGDGFFLIRFERAPGPA